MGVCPSMATKCCLSLGVQVPRRSRLAQGGATPSLPPWTCCQARSACADPSLPRPPSSAALRRGPAWTVIPAAYRHSDPMALQLPRLPLYQCRPRPDWLRRQQPVSRL